MGSGCFHAVRVGVAVTQTSDRIPRQRWKFRHQSLQKSGLQQPDVGVWSVVWTCRSDQAAQFEVSTRHDAEHCLIANHSYQSHPPRNVSAEIFVVCRDFLAPKQIDPKFLDPKHVFKDLAMAAKPSAPTTTIPKYQANGEASTSAAAVITNPGATGEMATVNIFAPEKKKRNRAGYADNDYTLYREVPVQTFVNSSLTDAATILGTYNRMAFDVTDPVVAKWKESRHTTEEVLSNCSDLKVLGKGDFKRLLKWRLAIRLEVCEDG